MRQYLNMVLVLKSMLQINKILNIMVMNTLCFPLMLKILAAQRLTTHLN